MRFHLAKLPEPPGTRESQVEVEGGKRGGLTLDKVLTDFNRYFHLQTTASFNKKYLTL